MQFFLLLLNQGMLLFLTGILAMLLGPLGLYEQSISHFLRFKIRPDAF